VDEVRGDITEVCDQRQESSMSDEQFDLDIEGITAQRLVRRGDHSTLYQAVQAQFGRRVAVKVYTADGARATALDRFRVECGLMGHLGSHPHVVTFFDSGVRRRRPYVVSEWFDHGTMADRLRGGARADWEEAAAVGVKLAGALESAHRLGLLHRKLKPEDVFVSAFGEPLVGDFHIDPTEGSRSGDPYDIMVHAAPELFRGGTGDPRSDVYALASVIFTLVVGRPPFVVEPDEPLVRIKGRALSVPPPDLRDLGVPAPIHAVLSWGLQPAPEGRPPTAQSFGRAMQAALVGSGRAEPRLSIAPLTDADRRLPPPTLPAAALSLIGPLRPAASAPASSPVPAPPPVAPPAAMPAAPATTSPVTPPVTLLPPPSVAPSSTPPAATPAAPVSPSPSPGAVPSPAAPAAPGAVPTQVITPAVLVERVRGVLDAFRARLVDPQEIARIDQLERRLAEPLRVAIAGKLKAGKSTLLNGLVGEELAPTDASECTRIVTWYVDGLTYAASLQLDDGTVLPTTISRSSGAVDVDLQGIAPPRVERITVEWPSSSLSELSIIDTPGVESTSTDLSERTVRFVLGDERDESQADAIIYLMRHLHPTDVRFLEAFQDTQVGHTNPINAIGVLSRADELAGAQGDAMEAARRVAARYGSTPQVRALCQTVIPVAGLLAQAAALLQQGDHNLLRRLADLPADERALLLASADHFVDDDIVGHVVAADRLRLIRLLGLYGVRLAIDAIADGRVTNAHELSGFLFEHSGLGELRRVLVTQFAGRRDVLKSQAVLQALAHRLRVAPPATGADDLHRQLEQLRAEAHVFAEIELFAAIRSGATSVRREEADSVERLLGAHGYAPTERLGLAHDAPADDVRRTLLSEVERWRRRSEHPLAEPDEAAAALVLARTCEGMVATMNASF
jgi:serine/threonine protein kinase